MIVITTLLDVVRATYTYDIDQLPEDWYGLTIQGQDEWLRLNAEGDFQVQDFIGPDTIERITVKR